MFQCDWGACTAELVLQCVFWVVFLLLITYQYGSAPIKHTCLELNLLLLNWRDYKWAIKQEKARASLGAALWTWITTRRSFQLLWTSRKRGTKVYRYEVKSFEGFEGNKCFFEQIYWQTETGRPTSDQAMVRRVKNFQWVDRQRNLLQDRPRK